MCNKSSRENFYPCCGVENVFSVSFAIGMEGWNVVKVSIINLFANVRNKLLPSLPLSNERRKISFLLLKHLLQDDRTTGMAQVRKIDSSLWGVLLRNLCAIVASPHARSAPELCVCVICYSFSSSPSDSPPSSLSKFNCRKSFIYSLDSGGTSSGIIMCTHTPCPPSFPTRPNPAQQ